MVQGNDENTYGGETPAKERKAGKYKTSQERWR